MSKVESCRRRTAVLVINVTGAPVQSTNGAGTGRRQPESSRNNARMTSKLARRSGFAWSPKNETANRDNSWRWNSRDGVDESPGGNGLGGGEKRLAEERLGARRTMLPEPFGYQKWKLGSL